MSLHHYDRALTRTFSLGRGNGYHTHVAMCSKCHVRAAYWLQRQGCYQRYFCEKCVKRTAAWKKKQATESAGGE